METLNRVVRLKDMKDKFEEQLVKLNGMRGMAPKQEGELEDSMCNRIVFESEFVSNVVIKSYTDPELNMLLVETAIKHYEHRIEGMTKMLNQIDEMLGGLEWDQ